MKIQANDNLINASEINYIVTRDLNVIKPWAMKFAIEYYGSRAMKENEFNRAMAFSSKGFYILIRHKNKDIGVISVRRNNSLPWRTKIKNKEFWYVSEAYILPEYRSKGFLASALEYVRAKHKVHGVLLSMERILEHRDYYIRNGFPEVFSYGGDNGYVIDRFAEKILKEFNVPQILVDFAA